ncbi:deoxyuridine 5'-triphosphate nucleotidohydrolase [candidate division KD3-62 bacterium DG_56]|uniref:Deoxyuridine 5'-triphosphate nucleotidohydrolase n=1 Tax=candidate division KD3-62 bacterium DG_56 TaxID=1704032 RepID=A0A0S7XQR9_9BACT|nr:MAG: deoxyuridine 5'-triphosphate nucleotidohydrolase [candidate division KD3-62 bacterium DG_56]
MKLQVERLPEGEGLPLPRYLTEHAAGMDLCAAVEGDLTLAPGEVRLIPTGFKVAVPVGCEAQIRPRSGLAARHGITLLNAPGTVDADYRGQVCVVVVNHGREPFVIRRGDRIAQMVIAPVVRVEVEEVAKLNDTARSEGGFGHTGI